MQHEVRPGMPLLSYQPAYQLLFFIFSPVKGSQQSEFPSQFENDFSISYNQWVHCLHEQSLIVYLWWATKARAVTCSFSDSGAFLMSNSLEDKPLLVLRLSFNIHVLWKKHCVSVQVPLFKILYLVLCFYYVFNFFFTF